MNCKCGNVARTTIIKDCFYCEACGKVIESKKVKVK